MVVMARTYGDRRAGADVKVRIGYGLGTRASSDPDRFAALVTGLEGRRFDSLWLSERITGDCPDPIVGLAVAAGLTKRMKLGFSVLVVPGRNPMVLAKELATLDRLSRGRLLPAFGLGAPDPGEHQAFGVERKARAGIFDEVVPLLRRFWAGEVVDHEGDAFRYEGAVVRPRPAQDPMDVWLGGIAPSELRRCGRACCGDRPRRRPATGSAPARSARRA
jgi:alkanesulfonate monooxygenase SsuD/methylene tetrahydromethanopterin reductase-like flavin-dependent oxidoreductase (luciferase family)